MQVLNSLLMFDIERKLRGGEEYFWQGSYRKAVALTFSTIDMVDEKLLSLNDPTGALPMYICAHVCVCVGGCVWVGVCGWVCVRVWLNG